MESVSLGPGGRQTSRLGFGCSSIMGALDERQSLAILESAFEAGIRHFDTAPMYGFGEAERCLGKFLARHRGEATVTTKFGIPAPASKPMVRMARAWMRPVMQQFPGLKKRLQRVGGAPAVPEKSSAARVANPIFTVENARGSLDASLAALKVERIDLWLLHDVRAVDLREDALLRFMEDAVGAGKIGGFGVGTDREEIPELLVRHPGYCRVTQYEWSVLNPAIGETDAFRIHHRALSAHFSAMVEMLRVERERCMRWSEEVGADLFGGDALAHLMLKASSVLNPTSLLLFSSKRAEHIRANVRVMEDAAMDEPARRLYELLQREQPRFG